MPEAGPDDFTLPVDGRQSPEATAILQGTRRLLYHHGIQTITEWKLPTGRRVDIAGLDRKGRFTIVEVKSSPTDFKVDTKWEEYLDWADDYYFAVNTDFPTDLLPADHGLIIADAFGAEIIRPSTALSLASARRTAMTRDFARVAAQRIFHAQDPLTKDSINHA